MVNNSSRLIEISFSDGSRRSVPEGISLNELSESFKKKFKSAIVAAKVDNDIKELNFELTGDCRVEFIDITNEDGARIYRRSLHFILIKAVNDLFPERKTVISHSISKGMYCEIRGDSDFEPHEAELIEKRMREIVDAEIPFVRHIMPAEEARLMFIKEGRQDRCHAIQYRDKDYVTIYSCDGLNDYFYGYMLPHTGYVKVFGVRHYTYGVILLFPDRSNPDVLPPFKEQKKLFNIFVEYKHWGRILGVGNVGALNDIVDSGEIGSFIRVAEALQEKKIGHIADMITGSESRKRIVLISGPSSSGKTTFANRLAIQLRVNGVRPVTISLDDYFVDRDNTPKDENGQYDYEALEAIDVQLFNRHLSELICGCEVEIPIFNFPRGMRDEAGRKLCIEKDQVIIIEGIHGLNERLTSSIPRESKFKVYVSALTSMNIDDHNRIPTTDTRVIRRMVRDHQFRGCSAINTLRWWPSVRRGEERNIFPYQEEADVMFNSSLAYELGVLKLLAEPLLGEVGPSNPEYSEAKRLTEFLSYFLPIATHDIPHNSIIREFIGGSCFYK
ncbi:uridine kinase [Anaerobacterium chartisolvens]|uniref:Uridine kinase n=1 Tax=Anaerobacterium chartisolvens TaxID=1297424 RepID=A0A369BEJ8_9FIRM|nr:nucleoside kinase [Anaerobacterium chartisolvens]RCX19972.1 uridine kinase [Anaerobacterium chartisolvens]